MTSLLLIISFLIHVVVLIAIFQLYQQIQQIKQIRNDTLNTKMQQFIDEIKQENDYLQQQLSQKKSPSATSNLHENVSEVEYYNNSISTNDKVKSKYPTTIKDTADHSMTQWTETCQEEIELSLEGKILQLHHTGLTVDDIAEKLTCGKTEVDLILNLQQQLKQNV